MGENGHGGAERSPADLEKAGRAALGRPVTAQAEHSRIEPANGSGASWCGAGRSAVAAADRGGDRAGAREPRGDAGRAGRPGEAGERGKRTADQIRAQFVDPDTGAPRMDRIAPVVGGVAGVLALVIVVKRRGKRKKK
ncbi:hypothetical protein ACU686_06550 [Yinghuangia aomiensis]